jgi:hypothetical protein
MSINEMGRGIGAYLTDCPKGLAALMLSVADETIIPGKKRNVTEATNITIKLFPHLF